MPLLAKLYRRRIYSGNASEAIARRFYERNTYFSFILRRPAKSLALNPDIANKYGDTVLHLVTDEYRQVMMRVLIV